MGCTSSRHRKSPQQHRAVTERPQTTPFRIILRLTNPFSRVNNPKQHPQCSQCTNSPSPDPLYQLRISVSFNVKSPPAFSPSSSLVHMPHPMSHPSFHDYTPCGTTANLSSARSSLSTSILSLKFLQPGYTNAKPSRHYVTPWPHSLASTTPRSLTDFWR
jgi:hypothetical protein